MKVRDDSGVAHVRAFFAQKNDSTKQINLRGSGQGATDTEVILVGSVREGTAPGEYYCYQLILDDTVGNRRLVNSPGIEFKIADVPGDHEGPEFEGWRYA
jgi:hypothetical protein